MKHKLANKLLPDVPLGDMYEYCKISQGQDPGQSQAGTTPVFTVAKDPKPTQKE